MTRERVWIVVLAVTCFFAGVAGGVVFSVGRFAPEPSGPFADYHARMVRDYDLDAEQADKLGQILAAYDERLDSLKSRQLRDLDAELVEAGDRCVERICRFIVPERADEFRRGAGLQFGSSVTSQ